MKMLATIVAVSLTLATGTVLAQQPTKAATPPVAKQQAMDHSKMDMQHDQMDHSKMDMADMSPADRDKMAAAQFAKFDGNKDGNLSKAEFAKLFAMTGMQNGHMDSKTGQMDHGKMGMSGMDSADHQKMAADQFAKLDANKDGKLTKSEIPAAHPLSAHFSMLDSNKDGSISKTEFAQHHGM